VLAGDSQQCPAGDEHLELRCGAEQRHDQRRGAQHLLEVVEHQQRAAVPQRDDELVLQRHIARVTHAERLRDRVGHERRVVDRGERHEHDPAGKLGGHAGRDVDRQPALADAARPHERDHAHGRRVQHRSDLGDLVLPPDELGQRRGDCARASHVRRLRGVGRRPALIEPLGQQDCQVLLEQLRQLIRVGEVLERRAVVRPDPVEQRDEAGLPLAAGLLDVHEARHADGREVVLVLEPGHLLLRRHPAVLLPVQTDEHVALLQVGAIQLPGRMRPGAELEHHGCEAQLLDGGARGVALRGQFLQR
jgi:hypothetical protein